MSGDLKTAVIMAAQSGDQQAQDRLVAEFLPLVYNIVGRALQGHADVDDVTQETMLRALAGLGGLRDPGSFRSWLVAITVNQIRGHWRRHREAPLDGGLDDAYDLADPGADFVDLTIARLGLAGQRREVAEATRWLHEDDRSLLSLWWLEAAGELTRAEVADALELSPRHTAVRVQRMKAQLEASRVVVRALSADPRCVLLEPLVEEWDGVPSALWRKRMARHARECTVCSGFSAGLVPAERLLAGLALVPVAVGAALSRSPHLAVVGAHHDPVAEGARDWRARSREGQRRLDRARRRRRTSGVALAVAVLVTAGGAIQLYADDRDGESGTRATTATDAEVVLPLGRSAEPDPSHSPSSKSPSPSPSPPRTPSPRPATKKPAPRPLAAAPVPAPDSGGPASTAAAQVLALVNAERAKQGCAPVRDNQRLDTAARLHSEDMAANDYFSHTSQDGRDPGDRIAAAGYAWSTYGENIARGQQTAADVMNGWMNSPGHRANILNCAFNDMGMGIHDGVGGPWWTQAFGSGS